MVPYPGNSETIKSHISLHADSRSDDVGICTLDNSSYRCGICIQKSQDINYSRPNILLLHFSLFMAIASASIYTLQSEAKTTSGKLEIWYKPNIPLGVAKGIFPGRVAWGHNPKIASWDGKTGFWWDDTHNNQQETDKLLKETLFTLTNKQTEKAAWEGSVHFL